ncbi:MAG: DUF1566 domain-containing protein [Desulfoplanes sp.]|nr:DUF1566 domain-containing protein [Desulfoplanes sp.]
MKNILWTEQTQCFDTHGHPIPCQGSGQDAETWSGLKLQNRFSPQDPDMVLDLVTNLTWTRSANYGAFPMTWMEALDFVKDMNSTRHLGHADWRLPNRRELRSLISFGASKPALSPGHLFNEVFQSWYWTSTTAAIFPGCAWYVHLEGGRMFHGKKDQYALVWPVRGTARHLPETGQKRCYDIQGHPIPCLHSGQDGELRHGKTWPKPRFVLQDNTVHDTVTDLTWLRDADMFGRPMTWQETLDTVADLHIQDRKWRIATINELESLVDASEANPALPEDHPFTHVRESYWSSTNSFFEPDWAHVLYLNKGAVGVGWKAKPEFYLWPVSG